MIRRFKAHNINNSISCDFSFHNDINVITGKNGSGKTIILKVIWYLMSANIERIPREMRFDSLYLETDTLSVSIEKSQESKKKDRYLIVLKRGDKTLHQADVSLTDISEESPAVRTINHQIGGVGGSLFFPTFRRIEGRFSMNPPPRRRGTPDDLSWRTVTPFDDGPHLIQQGFSTLSSRLSQFGHTFVASISTDDVIQLLTQKYAAISEKTNRSLACTRFG